MSKALLLIAGVAGVAWLVSQSERTATAPASTSSFAAPYSLPSTGAVSGRYAVSATEDDDDDAEARAEEVRQAKQEFEDVADELRSAVTALRYNRWDGQMSTIRSRLSDADDALSQLESLSPHDPAVQNARDEVDRMRSHLTRLHFENWRNVRPGLESSSSIIEEEAAAVSDGADDD